MTRLADTTPADFTVGDVISFGDEAQQYNVVEVTETMVAYAPIPSPVEPPPYVAPPPNRRQRRAAAAQQRTATRRSA